MSRDALIVGINHYQYGFSDLKSPAEDAEAIATLLNQYGDFDIIRRLPEAIDPETKQPYVAQKRPVSLKELQESLVQLPRYTLTGMMCKLWIAIFSYTG